MIKKSFYLVGLIILASGCIEIHVSKEFGLEDKLYIKSIHRVGNVRYGPKYKYVVGNLFGNDTLFIITDKNSNMVFNLGDEIVIKRKEK